MRPAITFAVFVAAAALAAACSGAGPRATAGCGMPPPVPIPALVLAYPVPGATGVSTGIGELIFAGDQSGYFGPVTVALTMGATSVPVGSFTAPPSPLPTPYATPGNISGNVSYFAAPIPTLASATTYAVSYTFIDWADNPPSCRTHVTAPLGTFTTR